MKKLIFITACLSAWLALGTTHYVAPTGNNISPYTNWLDAATDIQSAIDISSDGDTVIISNGIYSTGSSITITNSSIILKSLAGKNSVLIYGNGAHNILYTRTECIIDGLTLSNGYYYPSETEPGGGAILNGATMKNSTIINCKAEFGGGVFAVGNSIIDNCEIIGNSAQKAGGGAVISDNAKIINSTLSGNSVTESGSQTNLFFGGGGLLIFQNGTIVDSVITGNTCVADGGGIYSFRGGDIQRCVIRNNTSDKNGGGIMCDNNAFYQSCLIIDNSAINGGGAFILTNGTLQNCTISDNNSINGGGVFFDSGGNAKNSILFFNNALSDSNYFVNGNASFFYCVAQPAISNIYDDGGNGTNLPQFVNRSINNYRLLQSSFSIDSGTNLPGVFQMIELDGNSRVSNVVDRGAYELFGFPLPDIVITSTSISLTYDFSSYSFAGTNNEYATGDFWISNSVNEVGINFARSGLAWSSPNLPLVVGTNLITAYAKNIGNYVASDSIEIIRLGIGTGQPFVDITNENSSVVYDQTSFFVAGTNNIHTIGGLWITNFNNGYFVSFYPTTDNWFFVEVPLTTGTNDIYLYGTNLIGQITNDNVIIIREPGTGIPFVNITSEISFVTFDVTSFAVAGTNNAQVIGMWLTNNLAGTVSFAAMESWTAPDVPLAVGENFIAVFGTNSLGQITNDIINVTRGMPGTGLPFVDCTNNFSEVENNISEIVLAGTNNQNVVGKMRIHNPLTGEQKFFDAANNWTAPSISLDEGLNDIKIYGTNIYGDVYDDLVLITRKGPATGPPFVDITTSSQWVNYDFYSITVPGTNNSHVTGAMWISNTVTHSVNYFSSAPVWTSAPISLVVGVNTLWVFGQNAEGTKNSDSITLTRGISGTGTPLIQITNADKFVTFDVSSFNISGSANSNVVGTMLISNLLNNSSANFTAQTAWQAPVLPLDVGTNSFIVYGTNLFGEQGSDTAVIIREGHGSGTPFLDITDTNSFVKSDVDMFSVAGTNNLNIVGFMWISNSASMAVDAFPASNSWNSPAVFLNIGWNDLFVFGSNLVNQITNDVVRITRGTPGLGTPVVTILTTNSILNYDYSTLTIEGSINFNVMGGMWISNSANNSVVLFNANQNWTAGVPLDVGTNLITVYGTNYLNDTASDSVLITRLIPGTGLPFVDITNMVDVVDYSTDSYIIAGTNNANVVGYMWITNSADGSLQFFPASESWTAPSVDLDRHLNNIAVYGTNMYGEIAFDSFLVDRPVPSGVTNFVSSSGSHQWPYISWATAATNIETAVEETVDGNMVLVADETNFISSPMYIDKDIIVKSVSGNQTATLVVKTFNSVSPVHISKGVFTGFTLIPNPENSIIVSNGGCFYLDGNAIVKNCVFKNFSVAENGGAVYSDNGTISNCVIDSCYALHAGGAIYINNGALVTDCLITNNFSPNGGGVYISFTGSVSRCELVGNFTSLPEGVDVYEDKGGAVFCDNGGLIEHSVIHNNYSKNGSAVYFLSNGKIAYSDVYNNNSLYYAAVYCEYGGNISYCKILNNTALNGAGICLSYSGTIRNSLVANNYASNNGGGIYTVGNVLIESSTISSNYAENFAGGFYSDSSASLKNTVIYHNFAGYSNNYYSTSGQADFMHCCSVPLPAGEGNISDDPKLANPFTGFFKLAINSPCINAGSNDLWMSSATDLSGNPRILNKIVDMGGYEFTNEPILWLSHRIFDFGDVLVDTVVTSAFIIGNAGDIILSGDVQNINVPFFVESGSPYSITSLSNSGISIVFAPDEITNYIDEISITGADPCSIILKGEGIPEPFLFIIYNLLFVIWKFNSRN